MEERNRTIPASANLQYIAGYCSFSVNKKLQCKDCKLRITYQGIDVQCIENTLISGISKGSLLYPYRNVVDMIVTYYLMVNRLAETKEFQFSPRQRHLSFRLLCQHWMHKSLCFLMKMLASVDTSQYM